MSTVTSILSIIPENLHDQLKMEVLQQIEADKANAAKSKQAVSPMFKQVMDAKKKEREQLNKK